MMKRTLMLLSAMLIVSAGAFAQDFTATWEKAAAPSFLSAIPEADQEFYLYNVGAGAFYTYHRGSSGSPYWNTRASVNDTIGSLVYVSQTNPTEDSQGDFSEYEDQAVYYLISDVSGTYECTFATNDDGVPSWDGIWTDNDGETFVYFYLEDQGSGYFKFRLNTAAAGYEQDDSQMYLGVADFSGLGSGSTIATQANLVFLWVNDTLTTLGASYSDFNDTWAAVDPTVYDAYIEEAGEQNKAYAAAASLKSAIEAAYEANPGIDLSDLIAVYNNTSSTAEELEAAEDAISDAIVAFLQSQGSVDNPIEMTSALTNPDFSTGDYTGWSYDSSLTAPTVDGSYYNCEVWDANFNVYQEIGNLPEGVYRVDIQAFYRAGSADTDQTSYTADPTEKSNSLLYATSAVLGTQKIAVKRILDEAQYTPLFGETETSSTGTWPYDSATENEDGETLYTPNSMQGAEIWFDADYYWNELYFAISESDTIDVGFKKETLISYDWTIWDNFKIYYYGDEDEAYQMWAQNVIETQLNEEETRTSEYHGAPEAATFTEIFATLSSATDKATILEAIYAIVDAQDAFDESVENYATYVALCEEISEWLVQGEEDGMAMDIDEVAMLADYIDADPEDPETSADGWGYPNGNMRYILGYTDDGEETYEGVLSADEIAEEYEYLYALYQTAIANALVEGASLTNMLTNADFSTGDDTGWSYDSSLTAPTVSSAYYNCEVWNANFDVYQVITGLPEGLYAVQAQAFYRTDGYADSYTEWTTYDASEIEILTEIYLNDFSQPVCNVMEGENEEEDIYGDSVNPGGGYIPNSMSGFLNACEADLYWNTVYGLVTNDTLIVGIRNTEGSIDDRWSIWDNFQLTYMGKNEETLSSVLSDYLEQANDYFTVDAGQPDLEALSNAYDTGEAALESGDGDTMYDALYTLVEAINLVKASESTYEEFLELYTELGDALSEYSATASDEAIENASNVYDQVGDIATELSLSYTELDSYITAIEEAIAALKIPAYDEASDDNPIDFTSVITNPTFDDADDEGWTTATGSVAFNSSVLNAEFYDEAFDFYQDIYSLPEGMYEVRVSAYHRVGTYQNDWDLYEESEGDYENDESLTAYLYAVSEDEQASTPLKHMAAGATDDDDYSSGYYATDSEGNYHYVPNTMAIGYDYLAQENEDGTKVYGVSVFKKVGESGTLRIGLYCDTYVSTAWVLFDDFELYYYGASSSLEESGNPVAISSTAASSNVKTVTGIFSASGARLSGYQQGVNIVRMVDSEGNVSTMKVLVK